MLPNLRYVIITQVTRGGRSAVPRRRNSSSNGSNGAEERVFAFGDLVPTMESIKLGCLAAIVYEIVQIAEYHRTVIRYVKKRDSEQASKHADAGFLRKLFNSFFAND